ncbi:Chaperone protein DnaK [Vibrio stylophorae]|uniref:Chaperone protein DnaK n=1 Tax=Vibrio stylophorae TaxID=659351 RepID=A0ABM8ZS29_9VIBR|nr:molecular chaperone [Vibrio stylophorae]CAH0533096.1 Chaperone protein DnaK [Vibrio stylophorae]
MAIGFDYGTANCSVAHIDNNQMREIALYGTDQTVPSTISAPNAETISEYLYRHYQITPCTEIGENLLRLAIRNNEEEGWDVLPEDVCFGKEALAQYLADPKEVYYVKSPKSFLGAMGLSPMQLAFFEDLVCAMMANIKHRTELALGRDVSQTVIGRPVNFQGRGGDKSNEQAEGILRRAANRAGFRDVEFQFEPVAAGLEYEASLTQEQKVLVVDIGGGTTDCSMIAMGPQWVGRMDRQQTLLSHTGQLVGGNDLDIYIAFRQMMHPFGMGSTSITGKMHPTTQFWNAIAINDVQAQRQFYGRDNLPTLQMLLRDAAEPEKMARLLKVHQDSLGYAIIKEAENCKIALASAPSYGANLKVGDELLQLEIDTEQLAYAITNPMQKITALVEEAVAQAGCQPDAIFMTGGSARSPILQQAVRQVLPHVPMTHGNYFGSVTAGLARWANILFR